MATPQEARVPDIGGQDDVPVIEVLVAPGDTVEKDQGLITLESDKATMEVPAPFAGIVREVKVKVGDSLSEGGLVALIEPADAGDAGSAGADAGTDGGAGKPEKAVDTQAGGRGADAAGASADPPRAQPAAATKAAPAAETGTQVEPVAVSGAPDNIAQASIDKQAGVVPAEDAAPPVRFDASALLPDKVPHATPAVRVFARELGVDLSKVEGSARGGRITREDVQKFVKTTLAGGAEAGTAAGAGGGGGGLDLLPWPKVDFSRFGEVEEAPLSRIQKISGANLARNWAMIPHVTQHDEADVTALEALRVELNDEAAADRTGAGVKLTMLAFLMKASVVALRKFPQFNASLDAGGQTLVLKKYFHVGFAADTPNGLVVPVVRDVDRKGINEIATETAALAKKAREGKLGPAEMSGGCFSISSLGGIGGTAFTPIINAPEVAILGVSRSAMKPVWNGDKFKPRLMLPLSLSYDHRVIDGAAAARFTAYLAQLLGDMRRAML